MLSAQRKWAETYIPKIALADLAREPVREFLRVSEFDPKKVRFGAPARRQNRAGSVSLAVAYEDRDLEIQFPRMRVCYPPKFLLKTENKEPYAGSLSLLFSPLTSIEESTKRDNDKAYYNAKAIVMLKDKIKQLDEAIIAEIADKSELVFGQQYGVPEARDMFRPSIVELGIFMKSVIQITVPFPFGGSAKEPYTTVFFDEQQKVVPFKKTDELLSRIQENDEVRIIAKCRNVWVQGTYVGVAWDAKTVQIFKHGAEGFQAYIEDKRPLFDFRPASSIFESHDRKFKRAAAAESDDEPDTAVLSSFSDVEED